MRLNLSHTAKAASLLARTLGKVMPFWYALCLILLGIESYLHRHDAGLPPLLVAVVVWSAAIIYTVAVLVPINNRIAAMTAYVSTGNLEAGSQKMGHASPLADCAAHYCDGQSYVRACQARLERQPRGCLEEVPLTCRDS